LCNIIIPVCIAAVCYMATLIKMQQLAFAAAGVKYLVYSLGVCTLFSVNPYIWPRSHSV